jgi:photosystem II stability/assembly factor-like uncharacterized protein
VSEFDPIDQWLGTDVELLSPAPGTFDRIHRLARRRKAMTAATTAVGAAAAVAAAVVLPQFLPGFLPGHSNPNRILTSGAPSPSARQRMRIDRHRETGRRPAGGSGPASLSPPGQASISGSAFKPAAGFAPDSVTFVSGQVGAVLGQARVGSKATPRCWRVPCVAIAGTSSYGQSWYAMDAPPAGPPSGASGVSQVRFLNASDGWAFGPQLFSTHDGGITWTRVNGLPGRVIDLSTVSGTAYAVVAACGGQGPRYAADCTSFALYSSPAGYDDWQPVKGAAGDQAVVPGALQLNDTTGYLLAGSVLYAGSPASGTWGRVSVGSGPVPDCLDGHGHQAASGESGVIAPVNPGGGLYLLCQRGTGGAPALYQSADGGSTWQPAGTTGLRGRAESLAVTPVSDTLVAATSSGLYYSTDGRTWHRASLTGQVPAAGFSFVGMTTQTQGVAVPAGGKVGKIFITGDGGRTWQASSI